MFTKLRLSTYTLPQEQEIVQQKNQIRILDQLETLYDFLRLTSLIYS